jgi:hypothetical protein
MSLCILSLICRPSCPYFLFLEDEDANTATLRLCLIFFSASCPCIRVSCVLVYFVLFLSSIMSIFSFFKRRRREHRHSPVLSHLFLGTMPLCPHVLCLCLLNFIFRPSFICLFFICRPSSVFLFLNRRRREHRHAPVLSHLFLGTMSLYPRVLCPFAFCLICRPSCPYFFFKKTRTLTPTRSGSVTFVSRHHAPVSASLMSVSFLLYISSIVRIFILYMSSIVRILIFKKTKT